MTASSLISAVTVGVVIGLAGWLLIRRARVAPPWLPVAGSVGAALLATILARLATTDQTSLTAPVVVLQILFAAAGVAAVAGTADRSKPGASATRTGRRHQ